jgi:hypothetical protein
VQKYHVEKAYADRGFARTADSRMIHSSAV